jgi:hypothetical protein
VRIVPAQALIAAVAVAACIACGAQPERTPAVATPSAFTLSTTFASGRVTLTISPGYTLGSNVTVPVLVTATRGSVVGPLEARVVASGVNEGGAPAEALVQTLPVTSLTATPQHSVTTSVTWDGRDVKGALVPADAYSLLVDFRVDDGTGSAQRVTASATLHLNGP